MPPLEIVEQNRSIMLALYHESRSTKGEGNGLGNTSLSDSQVQSRIRLEKLPLGACEGTLKEGGQR